MSNVYITTVQVQYPNILATTLGGDTAHYIEVRPPAGLLIIQASFFKLTSQASHALKLFYIHRQFVNYYADKKGKKNFLIYCIRKFTAEQLQSHK
jgi:hypothetical protein